MVTMMCWFNTAAVPIRWTTYASATGKFVLGANANLETTGGGTGSHNHNTLSRGYDGDAAGASSDLSDDAATSTTSYTAAYINLRICYISSVNVRAPKGMILMSSGDCPPGWTDVTGTIDRYINVGATDGSENADTGGSSTGAHAHTFSYGGHGGVGNYVYATDSNSPGIGEWIKLRFCEKT